MAWECLPPMVVERGFHPGGRHAGDRGLNGAIWKSIKGRNSKMHAPLHKRTIGSELGGMGAEYVAKPDPRKEGR
jgi:hypothetical protein